MEKNSKSVMQLFAFWLIILLVSAKPTPNTICTEAIAKLSGCLPFLVATAPLPSVSCCDAVAWINQQASTTQDRRDLCRCLKSAAIAYKVDPARAKELPNTCKVPVPVPIVPEVDCGKIQA